MRFVFVFIVALLGISSVKAQGQERPANWSVSTKKISDCEYDIVFSVKINPGWHIYSQKNTSEDGPNPTKITFKKTGDYELVGKVKESKSEEEFDKQFEMKVLYFAGNATFTQRIKLKSDKKFTLSGEYEYQGCTEEKCIFPPPSQFTVEVPAGTAACAGSTSTSTVVPTATVTPTPAACVCDTDEIVRIKSATPPVKTPPQTAENKQAEVTAASETTAGKDDCSPWENFFLGLGAGFGAMIMPCIYSMIPLTVSFFLKRNKTRAAAIKDSMLYGFFIVISFVIPTMLITVIFGDTALSNIATNTYVNLFFFILFIIFALSFFGLFEITLPASWANKLDANADRGGVIGLFFMALTLVVVSFSCTAGFLGPLLSTLAAGKNYLCPLVGFTGFGLGIALPFMLFAFFPSMLKSLPKSGGWMTTFKVTVAFIELALAIKFLTNADNVNEWGIMTREVFITLWVAIFAMLTFYLLGVFRTSHDDPPGHLSVGRIIWATFFLSFTIYMIPGLWGAPLKLISGFPPPHYYAEAPINPFTIQEAPASNNTTKSDGPGSDEAAALEKTRIPGPEGLQIFKDDYEGALKYSQLVNKPLFLDFTGKACTNCRWMESNVWTEKEVFKLLRDSVVIVSLYVDSRKDLPESEWKKVYWFEDSVMIDTYGKKFGYMQSSKFQASAQPMYVVMNADETIASNGTIETERDASKFAAWLRNGINRYHSKKK